MSDAAGICSANSGGLNGVNVVRNTLVNLSAT
jgi:hypothetical protein